MKVHRNSLRISSAHVVGTPVEAGAHARTFKQQKHDQQNQAAKRYVARREA